LNNTTIHRFEAYARGHWIDFNATAAHAHADCDDEILWRCCK